MQHHVRRDEIGPYGEPMGDAITACVHCGFCLPACPTYQVLGQEMDSPRGRIYLMKQVLEGELDPADAQVHLDRCLGCLACETACPSGVAYHQLISPYREMHQSRQKRTAIERLRRWLVMKTLPYPRRFRWAVRSGRIGKRLRAVTPPALRPMLDLTPDSLPPADPLPPIIQPRGQRRARVGMLTGCVQQALDPAINRATAEVLAHNGVEVVIPQKQGCCGSLAWHVGEGETARGFARRMIDVFPDDLDAIVVNAAGCGSGMQEYGLMFQGLAEQEGAKRFSQQVIDVSAFLAKLGIEPPPPLDRPLSVAYHDACHLCHGQQVRSAPRDLLRSIEGVNLVELNDGELCCGSAGIYNIDQPQIAAELGRRKADRVRQTECDIVATGNIGCMTQIRTHLAGDHDPGPPVLHTMQILASAYDRHL